MRLLFLAASATALSAAVANAQEPVPEDVKINQLIIYGADPCPKGDPDEILVCVVKPEADRYRIPENLRGDPNDPASNSWANRATEVQYLGRSGIGSCSTTGPGGMIGCFNDIVRAARAERAGRDSVNWNRLIEEARQERLGKIDEQAEETEQRLRRDE